jgi:DNA mismatch repair protein MutS2
VFDKDGTIKDGASNNLKKIRQEIRAKEVRVRKELDTILKFAGDKGYTDQDSGLTIRDGRLVVPVLAEHKRRIKGLVVDESTTGKTVYLEPLQVFEQNNEIRELHFAENREIIALLTALTSQVATEKAHLLNIESFLGTVDFTRAKAKVAIQLGACMPRLDDSCDFNLMQAYHPALLLSHKSNANPVVPLDIEINSQQRVLVISGPNAGGKSVAIKTVGLLQLMLQSGMLVPVDEGSTMGCFKEIFVDIGDEQSIESDLSTYSSHLGNMKQFMERCTETSLFLIDEFGTGTEPQFGGAIAESILSWLVSRGARGLVTTHYGNLKKFAELTSYVVNAAMKFDLKNLEPSYILDVGRPGSSFALEIASKLGLPEKILKDAKDKIGHDPVAFEKLVSELELEKEKYLRYNQENIQLKSSMEEQRSEFQQRLADLDGKQKEIINQAKLEAEAILAETNQRIEATIREIKENKAQKAVTHKVRKELNEFRKKVKPVKEESKSTAKILPGPINAGDMVRIKGSQAQGEVLKVTGKSVEILMGSLKSKIDLGRLQKIGRMAVSKPTRQTRSNIDLHQMRAQYSTQLDIRGFRANQALDAVAAFIDQSILLGITDLRILHGKGDGVLRSIVRKQLQGDPSIKSIADEQVERGGAGVTLITLK